MYVTRREANVSYLLVDNGGSKLDRNIVVVYLSTCKSNKVGNRLSDIATDYGNMTFAIFSICRFFIRAVERLHFLNILHLDVGF